jgi:hypothetical protein
VRLFLICIAPTGGFLLLPVFNGSGPEYWSKLTSRRLKLEMLVDQFRGRRSS